MACLCTTKLRFHAGAANFETRISTGLVIWALLALKVVFASFKGSGKGTDRLTKDSTPSTSALGQIQRRSPNSI